MTINIIRKYKVSFQLCLEIDAAEYSFQYIFSTTTVKTNSVESAIKMIREQCKLMGDSLLGSQCKNYTVEIKSIEENSI